jgi:hypothetical protein
MIRRCLNNIAVVLAFLMFDFGLQAQVLPSLLLNQDPASLAMGSSGVASQAGAYALENNVAAIPFATETMAVNVGYAMWQPSYANLKTLGLGAIYRVSDKVGFGLDVKYLKMPKYSGITGSGSDIRDSEFSPSEMGFAAGFSYAFHSYISAGATLRFSSSSLAPEASAAVLGADLGLYFKKDAVSAGLSLNNIGTMVKYSEAAYAQPMLVKFGAGYEMLMGESQIFCTAEADVLFAGGLMAGIGCEYAFKDMAFARLGYHYGNHVNAVPSYGSAGLGFKMAGASLDLTYLYGSKVLANTLCLSLGYSF